MERQGQVVQRKGYSVARVKSRHRIPLDDTAVYAVRLSNLKKLFKAFKRDETRLAAALELRPRRVRDLLAGKSPVTEELAMHIEDELNLDGGWLSEPGAVYRTDRAGVAEKRPLAAAGSKEDQLEAGSAAKAEPEPGKAAPESRAGGTETAEEDANAQRFRKMNLALLTEAKGEKAALARAIGVHESLISLKLGARPLDRKFCEKIEAAYGVEPGWMDEMRLELPAGVKRLAGDVRRGRPVKNKAQEIQPVPAATDIPTPPAAAPQAQGGTESLDSSVRQVLAKAAADLIRARAADGTLSSDKILRLIADLTDQPTGT